MPLKNAKNSITTATKNAFLACGVPANSVKTFPLRTRSWLTIYHSLMIKWNFTKIFECQWRVQLIFIDIHGIFQFWFKFIFIFWLIGFDRINYCVSSFIKLERFIGLLNENNSLIEIKFKNYTKIQNSDL